MPEISKFEYPFDNAMFDPVRRLRVSMQFDSQHMERRRFDPLSPAQVAMWIYHDPEIEAGCYSMPLKPDPTLQRFEWYRNSFVPGRTRHFESKRSKFLRDVGCRAHDCGEIMRLKIHGKGFNFRSYQMRGSIEQLRIPLVSDDISSMYIDVFKAYAGLRSLRDSDVSSRLFKQTKSIEICVTTSALTEGLGRSVSDYPESEEGWHCLATWPR